jgi:AraC-like DNA-binding protein
VHAYSSGRRARRAPPRATSPPVTDDALSAILQDLRLVHGSYGRCFLPHPWGIDFPPQPEARFHYVVSGDCWLRAPKRGWVRLAPGDVALLPHGTGHGLAHRPRQRTRPLEDMPLEPIGDATFEMRPEMRPGGAAQTTLVCCSVAFGAVSAHPVVELMPSLLLVRDGADRDPVLRVLLDAMAEEVASQRVGAATIVTRLADVVITRVVRAWVESRDADTDGWLAAIRDPQIGRALAAIHQRPGDPWTVESLAAEAHTSRSVFAERFSQLLGVSPAKYVARWRMHVATRWLREDRVTVAELSSRLGYDSQAAFSRAFKRATGKTPSALRRKETA